MFDFEDISSGFHDVFLSKYAVSEVSLIHLIKKTV